MRVVRTVLSRSLRVFVTRIYDHAFRRSHVVSVISPAHFVVHAHPAQFADAPLRSPLCRRAQKYTTGLRNELQRIVMCMRVIEADLTELRRIPIDFAAREGTQQVVVLDRIFKYDLGARPQAHGHAGFPDRGEATGGGIVEFRRYQLVSDLCRPGCDEM